MQNGIYILINRDGYRVAYSDRFDNFFGNFNDALGDYDINRDCLEGIFGNCEVIRDENAAMAVALRLLEIMGETEDGIRILDYRNINYGEI